MSRTMRYYDYFEVSFPRVSGDEPLGTTAAVGVGAFSPRERG